MGCGIIYKNLSDKIDMKELFIDSNVTDGKDNFVESLITHEGFKLSEEKNIPLAKHEFPSISYQSEDLKNYSTKEEPKQTTNPVEFYDFEEHSMEIFRLLNKIRRHPEKFITKLNYIISKIDKVTNIADLSEKYHTLVELDIPQPLDAIAFLEKVSPKNSLLWSIKYNIMALEELEISINPNIKYSTNSLSIQTTEKISKIKTNFLYSPKLTVLLIFLMSEENRKLIFSDEYPIAAVGTLCYEDNKIIDNLNEKGNTLIYFVKSKNN